MRGRRVNASVSVVLVVQARSDVSLCSSGVLLLVMRESIISHLIFKKERFNPLCTGSHIRTLYRVFESISRTIKLSHSSFNG